MGLIGLLGLNNDAFERDVSNFYLHHFNTDTASLHFDKKKKKNSSISNEQEKRKKNFYEMTKRERE